MLAPFCLLSAAHAAPTTSADPHPWQHADALPPGAFRRLGSRALRSRAQLSGPDLVAVSDTGLIATTGPEGLVERSSDGMQRILLPPRDDLLWVGYGAGTEAVAITRSAVLRRANGASTFASAPLACGGRAAVSADLGWLICQDATAALALSWRRLPSLEPAGAVPIPEGLTIDQLLISNQGIAVARAFSTQEVHLAAPGAALRPTGHAASQVRVDDAHGEALVYHGEGRLFRFDLDRGQRRSARTGEGRLARPRTVRGNSVGVGGGVVVAAIGEGIDFDLRVLGTDNRAPIHLDNNLAHVVVSPRGRFAAAATNDGVYVLIDIARGEIAVPHRPMFWIMGMAAAPDGRTLAVFDDSEQLELWDVSTGAATTRTKVHSGASTAAFSPDGRHLAIGSSYESLQVLDARTLELRCEFSGPAHTVVWGTEGLVASGRDHRTQIDPATCRVLAQQRFEPEIEDSDPPGLHEGWIRLSRQPSPDGRTEIWFEASYDHPNDTRAFVVDPASRAVLGGLRLPAGSSHALAPHVAGGWIAAEQDGTVLLYHLTADPIP